MMAAPANIVNTTINTTPRSAAGPAGYGQSCTNCSRAKCKCILRLEGGACERCHRLNKDCQQMTSSRKRTARRTGTSRTAQLEEKLDDLVSILKSGHQPANYDGLLFAASAEASKQPGATTSALDSLAAAATKHRLVDMYPEQSSESQASSTSGGNGSRYVPVLEPTPEEAQAQLAKFRSWLVNFPFMHIPAETTSYMLQEERPFLWLCIRSITSTSLLQQRAMADRIRRELSERILMNSERSMDLLLGIITILAWATLSTGPRMKPFLILYSQLAETVIFDLGLLRFPNEEHVSAIGKVWKVWGKKLPEVQERTHEEKRAALALWFLTSICNAFTGRVETLRWTRHLEHCLRSLERMEEQPSDGIFALYIKIQLISDEANKYLMEDLLSNTVHGAQDTPTYLHKTRLLESLAVVRERGVNQLAMSYPLMSHLLATEAHIHAVGVFSSLPMPDEQRVNGMYQCVAAVRNWYEAFFSRPIHELPALPFANYISLSVMQVMLYRLTVLEHPMWDRSIVRNTVDVMDILDRTIEVFQQIPSIYPLTDETDQGNLYAHGARHLRTLKATWQPSVVGHLHSLPTPNSQQAMSLSPAHPAMAMNPASLMDQQQADFQDMAWIADIFGPWEM